MYRYILDRNGGTQQYRYILDRNGGTLDYTCP
jgi:hypothetical protein